MKDQWKALALLAATIAIIAALVFAGQRRESRATAGTRADVSRIESLARQGRLSIRRAEFQAKLDPADEDSP